MKYQGWVTWNLLHESTPAAENPYNENDAITSGERQQPMNWKFPVSPAQPAFMRRSQRRATILSVPKSISMMHPTALMATSAVGLMSITGSPSASQKFALKRPAKRRSFSFGVRTANNSAVSLLNLDTLKLKNPLNPSYSVPFSCFNLLHKVL